MIHVHLVHIIDHSNAIYLPRLSRLKKIITCHDLIAIRTANGDFVPTQNLQIGQAFAKLDIELSPSC